MSSQEKSDIKVRIVENEVCAGENFILPGFLLTFLASKLFLKKFKFKTILYADCLTG